MTRPHTLTGWLGAIAKDILALVALVACLGTFLVLGSAALEPKHSIQYAEADQ